MVRALTYRPGGVSTEGFAKNVQTHDAHTMNCTQHTGIATPRESSSLGHLGRCTHLICPEDERFVSRGLLEVVDMTRAFPKGDLETVRFRCVWAWVEPARCRPTGSRLASWEHPVGVVMGDSTDEWRRHGWRPSSIRGSRSDEKKGYLDA